MSESTKEFNVLDPDPWVAITAVVTIIGVVGQLATLKIALDHRRRAPQRSETQVRIVFNALRQLHQDALRDTERLQRLLTRAVNPNEVLNGSNRYGSNSLLLEVVEFGDYRRLVSALGHYVGEMNQWVLELIGTNPDFAADLGERMSLRVDSIAARVNALVQGEMTVEATLDECLLILRSFDQLFMEIDQIRN